MRQYQQQSVHLFLFDQEIDVLSNESLKTRIDFFEYFLLDVAVRRARFIQRSQFHAFNIYFIRRSAFLLPLESLESKFLFLLFCIKCLTTHFVPGALALIKRVHSNKNQRFIISSRSMRNISSNVNSRRLLFSE